MIDWGADVIRWKVTRWYSVSWREEPLTAAIRLGLLRSRGQRRDWTVLRSRVGRGGRRAATQGTAGRLRLVRHVEPDHRRAGRMKIAPSSPHPRKPEAMIRAFLFGWTLGWIAAVAALVAVSLASAGSRSEERPTPKGAPE